MKLQYIFFGLLLFSGCAKSNQEKILGKWKDKQGSTWEFVKDGTVIVDGGTGAANYVFVDKDRIKIQGFMGNVVWPVSFPDEETLIIGDYNGKTDTLTRVNN